MWWCISILLISCSCLSLANSGSNPHWNAPILSVISVMSLGHTSSCFFELELYCRGGHCLDSHYLFNVQGSLERIAHGYALSGQMQFCEYMSNFRGLAAHRSETLEHAIASANLMEQWKRRPGPSFQTMLFQARLPHISPKQLLCVLRLRNENLPAAHLCVYSLWLEISWILFILQFLVPTVRDRLSKELQEAWQSHPGLGEESKSSLVRMLISHRYFPDICEELMASCNKADATERAQALSNLISEAVTSELESSMLTKVSTMLSAWWPILCRHENQPGTSHQSKRAICQSAEALAPPKAFLLAKFTN